MGYAAELNRQDSAQLAKRWAGGILTREQKNHEAYDGAFFKHGGR